MPKSPCLKWTCGRSSYDYRVASKFEFDRSILTYRNLKKDLTVSYGRTTDGLTDPNSRKTSFSKSSLKAKLRN